MYPGYRFSLPGVNLVVLRAHLGGILYRADGFTVSNNTSEDDRRVNV
jgi:hypothetical protein